MAKTKIEVDLVVKGDDSVAKVEGKVVSLKQQLKNLKAELASGNLTGKEFDQAAKKAGELQDRIGDVSQRVKNLASDSQKLDGFISLTSGIVGGFAAVQGITALVGDENEELQKTMVKLQGAMSALAGIQAVANTLNKDSAALTALNTIKMGAQTAATTLYTFATGGATIATNAFRVALLATGIGAIVVLLGAAASAMGLFGETTDDTTESLKKQKEATDALNAKFKESDNALIVRYGQERDIAKARLKLAGATNDQLLEEDRKYLIKKKALLELQAQEDPKAVADLEAVKNEIILNNLEKLQTLKDAKQKQIDERNKNQAAKNSEDARYDAISKKRQEQISDANQRAKDQKEKEDEELAAYNLKIAEDEIDAEKKKQEELTRLAKEADEARIKAYLESVQAKESIARSSYSILSDLGTLALGEQFKQTQLGKTLALAQIATDTALAISALVRSSEANPLNAPTSGLAGIAQFTAGIARITANVVKAKSILSGGGTGGSSSGGGTSQNQSSAPPSVRGFIPQVDAQGNKTTKVVVLEKDITDVQNRVVRIRSNAELL